ncbi:MAG: ATP-binding protein, partial [Candidatus Heimdallarchaeota archaeon]|nr:ATP-binding protein [Candidatus Heimdallarchaeota archaeon]
FQKALEYQVAYIMIFISLLAMSLISTNIIPGNVNYQKIGITVITLIELFFFYFFESDLIYRYMNLAVSIFLLIGYFALSTYLRNYYVFIVNISLIIQGGSAVLHRNNIISDLLFSFSLISSYILLGFAFNKIKPLELIIIRLERGEDTFPIVNDLLEINSEFNDIDELRSTIEELSQRYEGRKIKGQVLSKLEEIIFLLNTKVQMVQKENIDLELTNKLLEKELEHLQRLEQIGIMAGGMSHDLKNSLSIFLGTVELMELQNDNPNLKSEFNTLKDLVNSTKSIADQLLILSKPSSLIKEDANVDEIIISMHRLFKMIVGKSTQISYQLNAGSTSINVNLGLFKQVLLNLIINSNNAVERDGEIRIETNKTNVNGIIHAVISIEDNGHGIPADQLQEVFKPYVSFSNSGSGLGLYMVKNIISDFGGSVDIYSEINNGTVVRISLPECKKKVNELTSTLT